MLIKIIDAEGQEYSLDQLSNFVFSFSKNESDNADYRLNLMNMSEIPIANKVEIFNLFERQLKNILIDQVIIEFQSEIENQEIDESYTTLFDSKLYNLTFKTVNYYAEYGVPGNMSNNTKPFDQIILSFIFDAE